MAHPADETILRYVAGEASGAEELDVDTHIAGCPGCLARVRGLTHLRAHFDSMWESWTVVEHGRAFRQSRLAQALSTLSETTPKLAEHARRWILGLSKTTEVALRGLIDGDMGIASAGVEVLPSACAFRLRPAIAGVAAAEELAKVEDHLQKGSELLSRGQVDDAVNELAQAAEIDARAPQAAVSEVISGERLLLQVVVSSRREKVSVKHWPAAGHPAPAFALLLPERPQGFPMGAAFQAVAEADYLLAEFEDVPAGSFTLSVRLGSSSH